MGRDALRTKEKDAQCSHHWFAGSITAAAALDALIDRNRTRLQRFGSTVSK